MSQSQLRNLLSGLADEATPVAMHDRAVKRYRRMAAGRSVLAGIAVLTLAGGAALGVAALPGESAPPAASPELDGRFIFATVGADTSNNVPLETPQRFDYATWVPGEKPRDIRLAEKSYPRSEAISRDGELLSYIGEDERVHVVDLLAGDEIELPEVPQLRDLDPGGDPLAATPTWSPDSKRLWLRVPDGSYGFVDIASGEFTATFAPEDWWSVKVVRGDDGADRLLGLRDNDGVPQIVGTAADDTESEPRVLGDGDDVGTVPGPFNGIAKATMDGSRLCLTATGPVPPEPGTTPAFDRCEITVAFDAETGGYEPESEIGGIDLLETADLNLTYSEPSRDNRMNLVDSRDNVVDSVTLHPDLSETETVPIAYDANP